MFKNIFIAGITVVMMILLLASCSSEKATKDSGYEITSESLYIPDIDLSVKKIYCWANLMPGSPNRLHLTGDITLKDSFKYDSKFVKLERVNVIQNNSLLYMIKPTVQDGDETWEGRNILFSTIKGILLDEMIDLNKSVNIELIFSEGSENYSYIIENVKVEQAQ